MCCVCVSSQVLQTQLQAATVATQIQQQQQTQQQLQGASLPQPPTDPNKTPSSTSIHGPLVAEETTLAHQQQPSQQQDQQQQQAITSLLTAQLASALGIDPTNPNTSQVALAGKVVCVHVSVEVP